MTTTPDLQSMPEGQGGSLTLKEIRQQPDLWKATLNAVKGHRLGFHLGDQTAIICGAGTSAYAASAVAGGWADTIAIPTTDLLLCSRADLLRIAPKFVVNGLLVSLARSGDSPESTGVVERVNRLFPAAKQLAITCNQRGRLAQSETVETLVLDPRTNDRSLVMTSSFSNLVLAGLALNSATILSQWQNQICERVQNALPQLESIAWQLAQNAPDRYVVLTSADLLPLAREACLKVLEMTAGRITTMSETFLGLRHGPMSFLRQDTLVLCVLSADTHRRRYEEDLLVELHQKQLGRLVVVGQPDSSDVTPHTAVPAMAQELPDNLRTPFEIVFPQLLAYHLSLQSKLNPDSPSPDGVITRVVESFEVHESIS